MSSTSRRKKKPWEMEAKQFDIYPDEAEVLALYWMSKIAIVEMATATGQPHRMYDLTLAEHAEERIYGLTDGLLTWPKIYRLWKPHLDAILAAAAEYRIRMKKEGKEAPPEIDRCFIWPEIHQVGFN